MGFSRFSFSSYRGSVDALEQGRHEAGRYGLSSAVLSLVSLVRGAARQDDFDKSG
jgi:hypothetical protein